MSGQQINHEQAKALAKLIHELRGDWDEHGVMAQLGYARHLADAYDLAIAAIRAAKSARNRTPAVIPLEGEHWRGGGVDKPPGVRPPAPETFCAVCSKPRERCEQIAVLADDGHAFTPNTRHDGVLVDVATGEQITRARGDVLAQLRRELHAADPPALDLEPAGPTTLQGEPA